MYATKLTREMLEDMGFTSVVWDDESKEYWINRYWYASGRADTKLPRKKVHKRIKTIILKAKRKYVQDNFYPGISFSYDGHNMCLSLSKFLYAWFKGEVPEGYVVDHIDNNHFNNTLDNLQLLTVADNNKKRFVDHEGHTCFNQFYNTKYDYKQVQKDWDMWEEWKKSNEQKKSN